MKSYAIILLLCGGTFVMGYMLGSGRAKSAPGAAPEITRELPAEPAPRQPREISTSPTQPVPSAPLSPTEPAESAPVTSPATTAKADSPAPTAFTQAIDTLVSPQATLQQKQAVWRQLVGSGQLDQAIDALKQGAAQNPNSALWQAELGQGELQKAGVLSKSGASVNEQGIMGMQADQSFDAALKIDPSNWEAQFFKAVAMSYWPAELNKSGQVVQMLSRLIDQQDTQPPQAQFAQTYAVLGQQYLKMGQPDYAQQTWQLGLQKFPTDPTLQKKVAGQ